MKSEKNVNIIVISKRKIAKVIIQIEKLLIKLMTTKLIKKLKF